MGYYGVTCSCTRTSLRLSGMEGFSIKSILIQVRSFEIHTPYWRPYEKLCVLIVKTFATNAMILLKVANFPHGL